MFEHSFQHFERLTLGVFCLRRVLMNNLVNWSSFISRLSVYMNDETSSHAKEMPKKGLFLQFSHFENVQAIQLFLSF